MDVLFELFPWVRAEFLEYMSTLQPQYNELNSALQKQLTRLENLLLGQGNIPINTSSEPKKHGANEPKKMTVRQVAAPVFDDDEGIMVIRKTTASGNAAQNFLNNAFKLVQ